MRFIVFPNFATLFIPPPGPHRPLSSSGVTRVADENRNNEHFPRKGLRNCYISFRLRCTSSSELLSIIVQSSTTMSKNGAAKSTRVNFARFICRSLVFVGLDRTSFGERFIEVIANVNHDSGVYNQEWDKSNFADR